MKVRMTIVYVNLWNKKIVILMTKQFNTKTYNQNNQGTSDGVNG